MNKRELFETQLAALVAKFERHRAEYLRPAYSEAQVRLDFINPFFEALGWDVRNEAGLGPKERQVVVEQGQTTGRPDYNFRLDGRTVFYVEAKAPHVPLERADVIMQAKSYSWSSRDVFVCAVTDFEEFRLYDATAKPDRRHPDVGLIFAYLYNDYLEPKTLDDLWLLSRESVAGGSIEQLLKMSSVTARQKLPVDQAFLDDLTGWREKLAKAVYKAHPGMAVSDLNSVVQVFLDRLVFIRIAEDRGILPPRGLEDIARNWEYSGKRRPISPDLNALFHSVNGLLDGEIFKPHPCEKVNWDRDAALVAGIVKGLYFPECPYRFDAIGVELLGSIYERYLGKTIRVTPARAVVEDKPEVRKAGGVYYTPKYIVDYIVEQTVGKLIDGKTPKQIEELRILDPACGSGSFLLGAYQRLLDYHERYYAEQARKKEGGRRKKGTRQARLIGEGEGGEFKLALEEKAAILQNNIYGVDIDPQAVEITMMSLYIKMLEGERGAITGRAVLPPLRANIKCGNSLIGHDIARQPALFGDLTPADLDRINPFDWASKSEGFGEIMAAGGFDAVIGNPPYIRMEEFKELKTYLKENYASHDERSDLYTYMIERAHGLLRDTGRFGMIVSNKFLRAKYGGRLRDFLVRNAHLDKVVDLAGLPVFKGATVRTIILLTVKTSGALGPTLYTMPLPENEFSAVASGSLSLEQVMPQFTYEVPFSALAQPVWNFAREESDTLLTRLKSNCRPLGQYCGGQIYRGVVSGLTEAFVIDLQVRAGLMRQNPTSAEIIKPLLTGRDVRRYHTEFKNMYLIYAYHGVDIGRYPAIEQHLSQFKERLRKRATRQQWYELQQPQLKFAPYMEGPKIIFPDIAKSPRFALDETGSYCTNTTYFIPGRDLYVLGLLNSTLASFYFVKTCAGLEGKAETYLRFFGQYLEGFPVRPINFSDPADKGRHDRIVALVERMLELHKQKQVAPSEASRARIEREIKVTDEAIDALVYELYRLTEEEIRVVEGGSGFGAD